MFEIDQKRKLQQPEHQVQKGQWKARRQHTHLRDGREAQDRREARPERRGAASDGVPRRAALREVLGLGDEFVHCGCWMSCVTSP
jgi:hypothetical protein